MNEESNILPPPLQATSEAPKGWRDLALEIAWTTWRDIHIKGSAAIGASFYLYGLFHPEVKEPCTTAAQYLGTYFAASALTKLSTK